MQLSFPCSEDKAGTAVLLQRYKKNETSVYSPREGKMKPFQDLSVSVSAHATVLCQDTEEKEEIRGERMVESKKRRREDGGRRDEVGREREVRYILRRED
jgi:hypothetical protein